MQVVFKDFVGHCEKCGGDEFVPQRMDDTTSFSPLACMRCGSVTTQFDLLMQFSRSGEPRSNQ